MWLSGQVESRLRVLQLAQHAGGGTAHPSYLTGSPTAFDARATPAQDVTKGELYEDARVTWRTSGPQMQLQLRLDAEPHPHEKSEGPPTARPSPPESTNFKLLTAHASSRILPCDTSSSLLSRLIGRCGCLKPD